MSEEEIAIEVLRKRSGYLNGYDIFTRSYSSSTQSRASQSEVIALREQVPEQALRVAEQEKWKAESDKRHAEQEKRYHALEAFVQQLASAAGLDPTGFLDITRGTTTAGDSTSHGDHDVTRGGGGAHPGP